MDEPGDLPERNGYRFSGARGHMVALAEASAWKSRSATTGPAGGAVP